jgi:hypothetical protein
MKTELILLKTASILIIINALYSIYTNNKIDKEVLNCEAVCENSIEKATITLLEEKVKDLSKKLEKCKDKKEIDCIYRKGL